MKCRCRVRLELEGEVEVPDTVDPGTAVCDAKAEFWDEIEDAVWASIECECRG